MKAKIMPPAVLLTCLALLIILHFILPIKKIIHFPYTCLGIPAIAMGIALNIWADNLFKKKDIPIEPHDKPTQLELSGPFRISRNPMYLGMALVLLGASIISGAITTVTPPAFFIFMMNSFFIPLEEDNLEKILGRDYLDYKQKVRRWI